MRGPCHTQPQNSIPSFFSTRNPIIGTVWYVTTSWKAWACDRRAIRLHARHSWPTLWLVLPCFAASLLPCSLHRTACPLLLPTRRCVLSPSPDLALLLLSQAHDSPCQPPFPRQECQSVLCSPSCDKLTTFQRSPVLASPCRSLPFSFIIC